jgi:hypothetical protein
MRELSDEVLTHNSVGNVVVKSKEPAFLASKSAGRLLIETNLLSFRSMWSLGRLFSGTIWVELYLIHWNSVQCTERVKILGVIVMLLLQPWSYRHDVIPALGRLRQDGCEFEASLGYIKRHCLKKKTEILKREKIPLHYSSS